MHKDIAATTYVIGRGSDRISGDFVARRRYGRKTARPAGGGRPAAGARTLVTCREDAVAAGARPVSDAAGVRVQRNLPAGKTAAGDPKAPAAAPCEGRLVAAAEDCTAWAERGEEKTGRRVPCRPPAAALRDGRPQCRRPRLCRTGGAAGRKKAAGESRTAPTAASTLTEVSWPPPPATVTPPAKCVNGNPIRLVSGSSVASRRGVRYTGPRPGCVGAGVEWAIPPVPPLRPSSFRGRPCRPDPPAWDRTPRT